MKRTHSVIITVIGGLGAGFTALASLQSFAAETAASVAIVAATSTASALFVFLSTLSRTPEIENTDADRTEGPAHHHSSIAAHCGEIAIGSASVSSDADSLRLSLDSQIAHIDRISASTSEMSTHMDEAVENTQLLQDLSSKTRKASYISQEAIGEATAQMQQTEERVDQAAAVISELESSADQISQISQSISGIADQTNLLALNAAIEAARAGEQGRGFAVVADEVRELAKRTSEATSEIGTTIKKIIDQTEAAGLTMRELVTEVNKGRKRTEDVDNELETILTHAREVDARVGESGEKIQHQRTLQEDIQQRLNDFCRDLNDSSSRVSTVAEQSQGVSEKTELIFESLGADSLAAEHKVVYNEGRAAVAAIEACFEKAIADGVLSAAQLFDRRYQTIAGSNPEKFSTQYDAFTDAELPAIQEPILERHGFIAYAGAVDENGYFPTHNLRYTQPLTGDYDRDLTNNRTKRIFSDRTGSRCGAHSKDFLLQTYKRDTGEVMRDMSFPITVDGRHWGGFRIGYQCDS